MELEDQSDKPPSSLTFAIIAFGLVFYGVAMLGYGLGLLNMDWFQPNPKTPHWVFGMIGLFLLFAGLISAARAAKISALYINPVFYCLLAVAMILAHWLVFYSDGGKCGVAGGNIIFWFSGVLCYTIAGAVVILFDLLFVIAAFTSLWKKLR